MARPYVSIGAGGPRIGVILDRRDVRAILLWLVVLVVIGNAINFTGGATDNPGAVVFCLSLGGAFAAIVWIACKIVGKPFRLHDD